MTDEALPEQLIPLARFRRIVGGLMSGFSFRASLGYAVVSLD